MLRIIKGTHRLDLDYAGTIVNGSPFDLKIYDASRIIVSELTKTEVNKQCEFTIDASAAGEGQLEIAINDGLIKNTVKQIKPGHYLVSFVPLKAEPYVIDVKFNSETVPGCPKRVVIKDSHFARLVGQVEETSLLNEEAAFTLADVHNLTDLQIKFKSQTGREDINPKLIKIGPTEFTIRWVPRELGTYTISVVYMEKIVKETPLKVKIFDPSLVKVANIAEGVVGKPSTFLVDASEAGEGSLEIGITCNGQFIPNQVII
jgi:filamin